ncbi:MAG: ATP-binding cassette domain-containing protein [Desulfobacterales bacterium]
MLLECSEITFRYPGAGNYLFNNLSLKITDPGFNGLFGPSGVGKTSLAKIVTGEIMGYSGEVKTKDMNNLLYSYNLERLPGWASVGNHIEKITPSSKKERKNDLIGLFGIEKCMKLRFSQLSLGQQNRINLLRYLLQDFHLLIMDESLANVDERTREKIILKIKDMFPETYFLYISHNVIEVSKYCKQILVLRSAHKVPQVLSIEGQNHMTDKALRKNDLENTMLEIMNAS